MVGGGTDVASLIADLFKKLPYIFSDLFGRSFAEGAELVYPANHGDAVAHLSLKVPGLLVATHADRGQGFGCVSPGSDDQFLNSNGAAAGMIRYFKPDIMQGIMHLPVVWQAEILK